MAVNLREKEAAEILTVDGAQVFIGQAGVKKPDHNDLTLIVLNKANSVGAVFTQNRFCAAPVQLCRQHLAGGRGIRALLVNTGNAGRLPKVAAYTVIVVVYLLLIGPGIYFYLKKRGIYRYYLPAVTLGAFLFTGIIGKKSMCTSLAK